MNNKLQPTRIELIYKSGHKKTYRGSFLLDEINNIQQRIEAYIDSGEYCFMNSNSCKFHLTNHILWNNKFTKDFFTIYVHFQDLVAVMINKIEYHPSNDSEVYLFEDKQPEQISQNGCDNGFDYQCRVYIETDSPDYNDNFTFVSAWTKSNGLDFSNLTHQWARFKTDPTINIEKKWLLECECSNSITNLYFLDFENVKLLTTEYIPVSKNEEENIENQQSFVYHEIKLLYKSGFEFGLLGNLDTTTINKLKESVENFIASGTHCFMNSSHCAIYITRSYANGIKTTFQLFVNYTDLLGVQISQISHNGVQSTMSRTCDDGVDLQCSITLSTASNKRYFNFLGAQSHSNGNDFNRLINKWQTFQSWPNMKVDTKWDFDCECGNDNSIIYLLDFSSIHSLETRYYSQK